MNRTKYSDSGVVHKDVEIAEPGGDRFEKSLDLLPIRYIGRDAGHVAAGGLLHFGNGAIDRFLRSAANRYRGAGVQELLGNRASDAASGAGDHGVFSF